MISKCVLKVHMICVSLIISISIDWHWSDPRALQVEGL